MSLYIVQEFEIPPWDPDEAEKIAPFRAANMAIVDNHTGIVESAFDECSDKSNF